MTDVVAPVFANIGIMAGFFLLAFKLRQENKFLAPLRLFCLLCGVIMMWGIANQGYAAIADEENGLPDDHTNEHNAMLGILGGVTTAVRFICAYLGLWGLWVVFSMYKIKKKKKENGEESDEED